MEENVDSEFTFLFDQSLGNLDEIFKPFISNDLQNISYTGLRFRVTENTRFIVHTSTIPLAHVYNVTLYERDTYMEHEDFHCHDCMLEGARFLPVSSKCPCLDLGDHVHEVCFLRFLRSTQVHHQYVGTCTDNASEFSFCKDSDNIFSDRYSGPMRKALKVPGFPTIVLKENIDLVRDLLQGCYWFKFSKISLRKCSDTVGFHSTVKSIKQAIYTINSLLIKLFYTVGDFSYKDLAQRTAELFDDLMIDYCTQPVIDKGEIRPVTTKSSVFLEIKAVHKHMKTLFNNPEASVRIKALEYPFVFESVRNIYESILDALNDRYNTLFLLEGTDYTQTLSWKFCMTLLIQTRSLGYLPKRVALFQDQQYRYKLNEPNIPITLAETKMISEAIIGELKSINYPANCLGLPTEFDEDIVDIKFQETISEIEMPVKFSASYHTVLSHGGRLEDCRILVNYAIKSNIDIPVYDLYDNSLRYCFKARDSKSYSKIVFWLSYQMAINFIIARYKHSKVRLKTVSENHFRPVYSSDNDDFLNAQIVHIQEPGKQRNLTKSTSFFTWFLVPGSKMLQHVLSELPEHLVGLKSSGDAWKFQQRLSFKGDGRFIYSKNGAVNKFFFAYSDWTEATDNINRYVGLAHLKTLMNYVGFPSAYREMINYLLALPQPVHEVRANYEELFDQLIYSGQIRQGFMMGNPMTKTILHLLHVSEKRTAAMYIKHTYNKDVLRYPGIAPETKVTQKLNSFVTNRI